MSKKIMNRSIMDKSADELEGESEDEWERVEFEASLTGIILCTDTAIELSKLTSGSKCPMQYVADKQNRLRQLIREMEDKVCKAI